MIQQVLRPWKQASVDTDRVLNLLCSISILIFLFIIPTSQSLAGFRSVLRYESKTGVPRLIATYPRHSGAYLLDGCLTFGRECGAPAAAAWCQSKGYERATNYQIEHNIGDRHPTKVFIGGAICDQSFCGAFASITCEASMHILAQPEHLF